MAGRQASNAITRYAGIQVQTSALGVNIPVGWGTFRCKCNLVDYLDFKSKAQKAQAGKGGSTTTGYSYSATIVLGVCEGPIDGVSTVYVDSKVYANGATTALAKAGLSLNTGAVGQAVWSYLTSNHPSHAIGYSGLAIAYASNYALGGGAATPNHSFEIKRTASFGVGTSKDADPSLVISDFFTNARYGVPSWGSGLLGDVTQYQNYCLAAGLLVSPVNDAQRSASEFLTEILRATNSTCVWSEGVLKFIPYGDAALSGNGKTYTPNNTVVYSLTDDHFVPQSDGEDPLLVDIMDQSDAYNVIQLEYLDRSNQYNMAIALASDAANVAQYGMRRKDPDTVHCICDPNVAAISAQLYLQRTLYIRAHYRFTLSWAFALLEPGDIVEITDAGLGLSAYPVRITQIDEDEDGKYAITAEDFPIGVASAPLYTMQAGLGTQTDQSLDPGGVEANLLLYSQDFSNPVWTKFNATAGANTATDDPYGGLTGQLVASSAAGDAGVFQQHATGSLPGRNFTFSVWLQQGTYAGGVRITIQSSNGLCLLDTDVQPPVSAWRRYSVTLNMNASADDVINVVLRMVGAPSGGETFWAWGAQLTEGVVLQTYAATTSAVAGPLIFNPPSVLTGSPEVWAAVAGGPYWGGAYVWVSVDGGTNYSQVGAVDTPSRYGIATASFGSASDPDTTDTLSVDLGVSAATLSPAANSGAADQGATLCLIDNELVCFESATLTNPSRYDLGTYIRRGYMGSTIAAHSAGAPFVRLDGSTFQFPYFGTNIGSTMLVKFQSFNLWGGAVQDLANCNAYSIVPVPLASTAPGSSAWSATGTTISNAGVDSPAIQIIGASDNAQATAVIFYYRQAGTSTWISAGQHPITTTLCYISSVASAQTYDVGVAYLVGGVPGDIAAVATAISVGAASSGGAPGSVLLNDSVAGSGKTFTCPTGSYGHIDVVLTAAGGDGYSSLSGYSGVFLGGSGGDTEVLASFAVTPGSTSITYALGPHGADSTASCSTGATFSLTAHHGIDATAAGAAAAPSAGSGGTYHHAGHAGGLTNSWDGGGAWTPTNAATNVTSGGYADQTTLPANGLTPGGGVAGSGTPGPANMLIIARA